MLAMLSMRTGGIPWRWQRCTLRNGLAVAARPRNDGVGARAGDGAVHVVVRPISPIAAAGSSFSKLHAMRLRGGNEPILRQLPPTTLQKWRSGFVVTQQHDGLLGPRLMSSQRRGGEIPRMKDFESLAEMTHVVHDMISAGEYLSTRDIAAYWTEVPKFLPRRNLRLDPNTTNQMEMILCHTLEVIQTNIDSFHPRDLAQTAIALAKIIKKIEDQVAEQRGRSSKNSPYQLLHGIFIGKDSLYKQFIMKELAVAAMPMREEFETRHLSNVIYAFGLTKYVLLFGDGSTAFDVLAKEALSNLNEFNEQGLSNVLWAYATANESHPKLFQKVADHIVSLDSMESFKSQDLSNTVWAYATAKESHPKLFQRVAEHMVTLDLQSLSEQTLANIVWAYATAKESHPKLFQRVADHIVTLDLRPFKPQALSNIVWAFATANESHPKLFKTVADHIVTLDLQSFNAQALANTVWAYAAAKEAHPKMFNRVADHIVSLDNMRSFNPQNLSNTVWAYATAGESHPELFRKVADVAMQRKDEFNEPQHIANLLWAFATIGELDRHLFESLAPTATNLLGKCNEQNLANLAWAYAVANMDAPAMFNEAFVSACIKRESDFILENLTQLHQWNLWQQELHSNIRLPQSLGKRCRDAFIRTEPRPSALQGDVISELTSVGLQPQEEFLTERGYRLDALVEVNGGKVGVEVDGPSHFVGRQPTGRTLLKRRQVAALDEIPVVWVPYWEWQKLGKLGKSREEKQLYLRSLLGLNDKGRTRIGQT